MTVEESCLALLVEALHLQTGGTDTVAGELVEEAVAVSPTEVAATLASWAASLVRMLAVAVDQDPFELVQEVALTCARGTST